MARIHFPVFKGMLPSANKKQIPDANTQVSENVDTRYGDFRPHNTDSSVAAVPLNTATLYRMARNGSGDFYTGGANGWITSTGDVDYVRGPISEDTTERTYYTGDGVPKATDTSLAVRTLGVEPPATAPTHVLTLGEEFTSEEYNTYRERVISDIVASIRLGFDTKQWIGLRDATGYTQWTTANGFPTNNEPFVLRGFAATSGVNGVQVTDPDYDWTTATALDGFYNSGFWVVPLHAYGYWYVPNPTTLDTNLGNILDPNETGSILQPSDITAIKAALAEYFDPEGDYIKNLRDQIDAIYNRVNTLLTTTLADANKLAISRFYSGALVSGVISDKVAQISRRAYEAAKFNATYDPNLYQDAGN